MAKKKPSENELLQAELAAMLDPKFDGITVEVGANERWDRTCVTFRWAGFADLLPEERFQRLARAIPDDFREARLAGLIWIELALEESVDDFLALARSEDIADREAEIYARLVDSDFFLALQALLGGDPGKSCRGDFSRCESALKSKRSSPKRVQESKLLFIKHGAYCDCQVLETVRTPLAEAFPRAAKGGGTK